MRYDKRTRQVLDFITVTHNPDIRDLKKKAVPGEMEITPEWVLVPIPMITWRLFQSHWKGIWNIKTAWGLFP